jgi:hypothetical protein
VFVPIPVKADAQDIFLRGEIIQRFEKVISGRLVNFDGDSSDTFRQVRQLDLIPGGAWVGHLFSFADQLELGEQRIDPKVVPLFTFQWRRPLGLALNKIRAKEISIATLCMAIDFRSDSRSDDESPLGNSPWHCKWSSEMCQSVPR